MQRVHAQQRTYNAVFLAYAKIEHAKERLWWQELSELSVVYTYPAKTPQTVIGTIFTLFKFTLY